MTMKTNERFQSEYDAIIVGSGMSVMECFSSGVA